MSFSAGTFSINSQGQPVVSGTTISSTVFNALTADLATGLSTCMLKDGTQTATAAVPFAAGVSVGTNFVVNSSGAITGTSTGTQTVSGPLSIAGASAGQIAFPATQNPSTNANTLDDYEEGTWTPSVGGTATYTAQVAHYVKVGKWVTVQCNLIINSIGSGSANTISGLPFATSSIGAIRSGAVSYFATLATNVLHIGCYAQDNNTTVRFVSLNAAGASATDAPSILGSGTEVNFTITYQAVS